MTDTLDGLDLSTARVDRGIGIWVRRALVLLMTAVPVLGLLNYFGQSADDRKAESPVASLTVRSPEHVRGGLLYESRFTIVAHTTIKQATLNLGGGWANGITINTLEPSPTNETSDDGNLSFQLGSVAAGKTFVLHMEYQVNPTTVGSRRQQVELADGTTPLLSLTQHLTVLP